MIIKQVLTLYRKYYFPFSSGLYPASVDVNEKKNKLILVSSVKLSSKFCSV